MRNLCTVGLDGYQIYIDFWINIKQWPLSAQVVFVRGKQRGTYEASTLSHQHFLSHSPATKYCFSIFKCGLFVFLLSSPHKITARAQDCFLMTNRTSQNGRHALLHNHDSQVILSNPEWTGKLCVSSRPPDRPRERLQASISDYSNVCQSEASSLLSSQL